MFDRWAGTSGPAIATPPRAPSSVRRTSSIDMLRPQGPNGPLVLEGRGRDLATDGNGRPHVIDSATLSVTVDFTHDRRVVASTVADIVGLRAGSGFRDAIPNDGTLMSLLLDEVPVATLISRAALSDDGADGAETRLPTVDVCAGWAAGGRLAVAVTDTGRLPPLRRPIAPALSSDEDEVAWHDLPHLPEGSMRRVRRIDVHQDGRVESLFRDSLAHATEGHVVIHEYAVSALIENGCFQTVDVRAHVLPAPECPQAVASASRAVGRPLTELRQLIRKEFQGVTTCTHLNDHLRALGDVWRLR